MRLQIETMRPAIKDYEAFNKIKFLKWKIIAFMQLLEKNASRFEGPRIRKYDGFCSAGSTNVLRMFLKELPL